MKRCRPFGGRGLDASNCPAPAMMWCGLRPSVRCGSRGRGWSRSCSSHTRRLPDSDVDGPAGVMGARGGRWARKVCGGRLGHCLRSHSVGVVERARGDGGRLRASLDGSGHRGRRGSGLLGGDRCRHRLGGRLRAGVAGDGHAGLAGLRGPGPARPMLGSRGPASCRPVGLVLFYASLRPSAHSGQALVLLSLVSESTLS